MKEKPKHRKYKLRQQQAIYDRLLELGTPQKVSDAQIWGSILGAFKLGYEQVKQSLPRVRRCTFDKTSQCWAAYYAGRDAALKEKQ